MIEISPMPAIEKYPNMSYSDNVVPTSRAVASYVGNEVSSAAGAAVANANTYTNNAIAALTAKATALPTPSNTPLAGVQYHLHVRPSLACNFPAVTYSTIGKHIYMTFISPATPTDITSLDISNVLGLDDFEPSADMLYEIDLVSTVVGYNSGTSAAVYGWNASVRAVDCEVESA